jgi:SAM-dependent methyltransferase
MSTDDPTPSTEQQRQSAAVKDRYADEAMAASYVEIEWPDHVPVRTAWAGYDVPLPTTALARRVIDGAITLPPTFRGSVLDVGGATGRLLWEWLQHFPETSSLTLVEPSTPFIGYARRFVLGNEREQPIPVVDRPSRPGWLTLERWPEPIRPDLLELVNATFEGAALGSRRFDVVSCCNVADRHPRPQALVDRLAELVAPGGCLLLASPLDWRTEYTSSEHWVDRLEDLLPPGWRVDRHLDEPYVFRYHVRHRAVFSTEVICCSRQEPGAPAG